MAIVWRGKQTLFFNEVVAKFYYKNVQQIPKGSKNAQNTFSAGLFIRLDKRKIYICQNKIPPSESSTKMKSFENEIRSFFNRNKYKIWLRLGCFYFWSQFCQYQTQTPYKYMLKMHLSISSTFLCNNFRAIINIFRVFKSETRCSYKSCSYKKECI